MGVCHFPSFRAAMETTQAHRRRWARSRSSSSTTTCWCSAPTSRCSGARSPTSPEGQPNCLLLVEFAGDDLAALRADLKRLDACMADHGFPDAVVEVVEPARQRQVWDVREACLNIMMSMKGDGKPVSFIEDCAVPLEHLADYTDAVTELFARHGTRRHLVRPRLRRLPARPPDPQHEGGGRRPGDAGDRRGGLRPRAPLQGLAFRRARRRHLALGVPRARCSGRGWCAPSRRSRTASTPTTG